MKVMLSCGEPSGDLYAGALATHIRRLEPTADVFGLGGECVEAAGGRLVADYRGTGRDRSDRGAPGAATVVGDVSPLGADGAGGTPSRVRGDRLLGVQFPPLPRHRGAWYPGGLLHQPASLGLAPWPAPGHGAFRDPRPGDFSV